MTYTPYLIANYATGLNRRLQPWLIPDDAQEAFFDGYVYRGTMSKREGYIYYATGQRGGSTYRESRIVRALTAVAPSTGVIDGANTIFTWNATAQIARGSITINGSNPVVVATDNGLGAITGVGVVAGVNSTVNYTTGVVSIEFLVAPIVASTVVLAYSFMPGNPVMMIANFITATNVKELIVADTQYVNRYNSTLNILQDISTTTYTGDKFQFFTWVNYESGLGVPRLLFSNNKDVIQQYNGTTIVNYAPAMNTTDTVPVPVTTLTCLLMFEVKDRLVLLRTTENGTIYGKRIRISGTGASSDDFTLAATGAGFIDIPDGTWIFGAAFNRDDLVIFTEQATWVLKYTGNDVKPFVLNKLDESRGSDAPFAAITYLNRTSAASRRGLINTDGYRVERQDLEIPDFSFNEVDPENFRLCFAGSVDADRDHYLIYPNISQATGSEISRRILVTNYDEDNYTIYRLPLSCMGNYKLAFNTTWADLLAFNNWAEFGAAYENWNSFAFSKGSTISLGGGHKGEIWQLVNESEDNPVKVYNITVIDASTIQVTTDWNNYDKLYANKDPSLAADTIFLTGITGMVEVNNQQFAIDSIISNTVFNLRVNDAVTPSIPATSFGAYTGGGTASRVIPFYSLFKQFNPYIEQDKKVRCGWLYMYVDAGATSLVRKIGISSITQSLPAVVTTAVAHSFQTGQQISFSGVGGMTELEGNSYFIRVLDSDSFELNGVDSTAFTPYTSGGYAGAIQQAKLTIQVFTNDRDPNDMTQLLNQNQDPYEGNCTNLIFEDGIKKWYKVYINQVGKFVQFLFTNTQAGAQINIQATMPGFLPLGRII